MNSSFILSENNAIVSTNNGEQRVINEFNGNIKEILEQENIIENLKNMIGSLETEDSLKDLRFFSYFPFLAPMFMTTTTAIMCLKQGYESIAIENIEAPNMIFPMLGLIGTGLFIYAIGSESYYRTSLKKYKINKVKGEYLKKELQKAEDKLAKLKVESSVFNIPENCEIKIDSYKDVISVLKRRSELYHEIREKIGRYMELLDEGILREKLIGIYSIDDVKFIEEIVKEESKKLEYSPKN